MRLPIGILLLLALFAVPGVYSAETYPSRPIRFIVPFGAGTVTDHTARLIGRKITGSMGQPVVVDNRPGANGIIGSQAAAQAVPDGYTLVMGTNTSHAANLALYKKLPYDPVKDFVPISNAVAGGIVLVANPVVPARNIQELVGLAKQRPGKLTYGSANSATLVGMEQLKALSGITMVNVPYKTVPAMVTDLLGGQIDIAFGDTFTMMPLIQSGKLRSLGISTPKRMSAFPHIPTVAEQGVPGFNITAWLAVFAPAGTPPEIIAKLNGVIVAGLKTQEVAEFFGRNGWEPAPSTPEELRMLVRNEIERWGRMIKAAGIQPE